MYIFLTIGFCSLLLCSNAIKFTGKGKKIEVRVSRKMNVTGQELVLIACKDQGAGLSKENLKLLFGEGVQFHANKLQAGGGSGLGLFITKGIVTLHDGAKIMAESEGEGKGCTFVVELPLVAISPQFDCEADHDGLASPRADEMQDDAQSSKCSEIMPLRAISMPLGPLLSTPAFRPRVLIVDDSLMNRRMLARMLETEGFECFQAVDGLAAVAVVNRAVMHRINCARPTVDPIAALRGGSLRIGSQHTGFLRCNSSGEDPENSVRSAGRTAQRADVILMDSNMPKMNGPDAIIEIRKMGFTFPIFGVTGDENHVSFMKAGADGVMMKPMKADQLVKAIKTALRRTVECAIKDNAARQAAQPPTVAAGLLAPGCLSAVPASDDDEHLKSLEGWLTAPPTPSKK